MNMTNQSSILCTCKHPHSQHRKEKYPMDIKYISDNDCFFGFGDSFTGYDDPRNICECKEFKPDNLYLIEKAYDDKKTS